MLSRSSFVSELKWINRKVWGRWLAAVGLTFGVLEWYSLRTQRGAPEDPCLCRGGSTDPPSVETLDAQGLSEKAAFPTLSAYIWELAGIYPPLPRRTWTRPVMGVLLLWFTAHMLFMIPWPLEHEVISSVRDRVRNQRQRR